MRRFCTLLLLLFLLATPTLGWAQDQPNPSVPALEIPKTEVKEEPQPWTHRFIVPTLLVAGGALAAGLGARSRQLKKRYRVVP